MELEHRFDLPVGIDKAWATVTDIATVGPCFPGASLDSVDGAAFTGSVKLKVGPARLIYLGKARIIEQDDRAHTATIEATGHEGGSSGATMLVTATAKELSANRTQIDLITTLSLTGRPAQFGRPVMVEVGNRLISQFADCISTKLVGRGTGGATLVDVENPDEIAAEREVALAEAATWPTARRSPDGPIAGRGLAAPSTNPLAKGLSIGLGAVLTGIAAVLLRRLLRR